MMFGDAFEAADDRGAHPVGRGSLSDAAMSDGARMKSRNVLLASAVAVTMLAAGCSSSGSGGGSLKLEKTNIVVNAFPAIDSAGLYIAQDQGLFAAHGLHVTIVPVKNPPPSTQDLINGQEQGEYDITAGDYVTYIEDQLGVDGAPRHDLRIIAEASFLQPNVLTLLVKGGSQISSVGQLRNRTISVNAPNDIGTLLIDSLLREHGVSLQQVHYANVPFPGVATALTTPKSPISASFAPEPFASLDEASGLLELADLDQGSTQDFPIEGYAVTQAWAQKYPNTLKAFATALSQGQQIADTDRAAVESALEKYLGIPKETAAFISLPTFPLGVDPVRLQRVVNAMSRFGLLPQGTNFDVTSMISG
jgi:NitT/TauT family transport system substrate-binding protein